MPQINPTQITPMGPWPDVETGVEKNWSKLRPGGVKMEAVLVHQRTFSEALKQAGVP
jgi:glutathionyl-hydroquinone reductase